MRIGDIKITLQLDPPLTYMCAVEWNEITDAAVEPRLLVFPLDYKDRTLGMPKVIPDLCKMIAEQLSR